MMFPRCEDTHRNKGYLRGQRCPLDNQHGYYYCLPLSRHIHMYSFIWDGIINDGIDGKSNANHARLVNYSYGVFEIRCS